MPGMKKMLAKVHGWSAETRIKWPRLWGAQNGKCFYCGCEMLLIATWAERKKLATVDHFLAHRTAAKGKNFVYACSDCNNKKGNRRPTEEEINRYQMLRSNIGKW